MENNNKYIEVNGEQYVKVDSLRPYELVALRLSEIVLSIPIEKNLSAEELSSLAQVLKVLTICG